MNEIRTTLMFKNIIKVAILHLHCTELLHRYSMPYKCICKRTSLKYIHFPMYYQQYEWKMQVGSNQKNNKFQETNKKQEFSFH